MHWNSPMIRPNQRSVEYNVRLCVRRRFRASNAYNSRWQNVQKCPRQHRVRGQIDQTRLLLCHRQFQCQSILLQQTHFVATQALRLLQSIAPRFLRFHQFLFGFAQLLSQCLFLILVHAVNGFDYDFPWRCLDSMDFLSFIILLQRLQSLYFSPKFTYLTIVWIFILLDAIHDRSGLACVP